MHESPDPRRWLFALFLSAPLWLVRESPAATIIVDASCSLVEAIRAANDDLAGGGCPAGDGLDELILTLDVSLAGVDNVIDGQNGLPSITSEITILGNGHRIARDTRPGVPDFRLFHIGEGARLTLFDLEVSGGSAREGGTDQARGGAFFNRGSLQLFRVTARDNLAKVARPGPVAVAAAGGAIYNLGSLGIFASHLLSNEASAENGPMAGGENAVARGGAIFSGPNATTSILLSELDSNFATAAGERAHALGGAIYSEARILQLRETSLVGNLARASADDEAFGQGGAIWAGGLTQNELAPTATLEASFLRGNQAASWPSLEGEASGGALFVTGDCEVEIDRSTFTANNVVPAVNELGPSGGAIEARVAAQATLRRVTLVRNGILRHPGPYRGTSIDNESTESVLIEATIVADSQPTGTRACSGTLRSRNGGNNFGCFRANPAVTGLSPAADDNGGPTRTHALDPTSNAIDAHPTAEILLDQRGVSALGDVDSGAYEHNPCTGDDLFEELADDSSDDTCPGNRLFPNQPQTHRHCDADWIWFNAEAGKTYELRTLNLVNGAETSVSVYEPGCGELLATEEEFGLDPASRLFITTPVPQSLDVEITQERNSYNPGSNPPATVEGYDVQALCIANCACTPPEGPNLELKNDRLERVKVTYEACSTIFVEDEWQVGFGSEATLRAGSSVVLGSGVSVAAGATLSVEIDSTLLPP